MALIVIMTTYITTKMNQLSIFLIDRDQSNLNDYQQSLDARGYNNVSIFNRATETAIYLANQPDVVFLGNNLGYELAIELLKCFRSVYPDTDVILLPCTQPQEDMMPGAKRYADRQAKPKYIVDYILCVLDRLSISKSYRQSG